MTEGPAAAAAAAAAAALALLIKVSTTEGAPPAIAEEAKGPLVYATKFLPCARERVFLQPSRTHS